MPRTSSPTKFARFSRLPEFESHDSCEVFEAPDFESHDICESFDIPEFESHDICEGFDIQEFESHDISTLGAGVPGVLCLYYKNRLSSHGSSGRPRRTTFVLQSRICSHGSPGVLRLYDKSRLSSHGRSTTEEDFESPKERTGPRQCYFCTTKDVFGQKQKTQKHDGFGAATTRKPAEGLRLCVKNVKARRFWRRDPNPQRVDPRPQKKSAKHDSFSAATTPKPAEGCPRPARNVKK